MVDTMSDVGKKTSLSNWNIPMLNAREAYNIWALGEYVLQE